jgi:small glutamine-rich tetratricopeptide repeat-containing protein alpha
MMRDPSALQNLMSSTGGDGMPDVASLMSNPAVAEMAQNMMKDPSALNSLMNNPDVAQMAEKYGLKK